MQSICRTCLQSVAGKTYFSINDSVSVEGSDEIFTIKKMLKMCIPEMAVDAVRDAVVCNNCLVNLSNSFNFRSNCLQHDQRLLDFISSSITNLNFSQICDFLPIYTCETCNKTFVSDIFLKKHMKNHHENKKLNDKYLCGVCGKTFNVLIRLKVHNLTHKDGAPSQTNVEDEVDCDESVSSRVAPFIITSAKNVEQSGKYEVVNITDGKEEFFKTDNRKVWSEEETVQFLNLCKRYVKDIHQGHKKTLWHTISKRLATKNIRATRDQCKTKWKNLCRTYHHVNKKLLIDPFIQTKFLFMNEIGEIMEMVNQNKIISSLSGPPEKNSKLQDLLKSLPELHPRKIEDQYSKDSFVQKLNDLNCKQDFTPSLSKAWKKEETLALLDCIRQRMVEFCSNETKSEFWVNVANDIRHCNYEATPDQCDSKWKSLKRSHRSVQERCLDKKTLNTRFSFYNLVDDIVKEKSKYANASDKLEQIVNDNESTTQFLTETLMDDNSTSDTNGAKRARLTVDKNDGFD